ncbi:Acetylornithine deacetylase or succinyl-diaminopimelate desuccinylase (plasmid) [Neorhizobium galegae bv. officinalis bv. officinalis str. HAMBI 1141]|uniref:Acetylornithine deacetylase or succinyl-diaminopimelate desuccinylase n=1 Tax=Neorhizobium galegae bv. officinalis bv. officinalis str. HAMBI 1141 TaxID=1028801 RepID=A0A068TGU7_NEOGA|nr:M20/M25/M40 family metallo-hydrolase [Neorhizobium galegae]CDN57281.1 Acetylornithine deacetylase or succinyl-diaminopimelate desuccinylase [Neorhizobium galegae bv. officinalis bv. officinalis str. HAMBI 1141]
MNTPQPASSQQVLGSAMAAIERDVEVAVDDLARMIEVDTSFPPGLGYDAFADLMAELLSPLGFEFERVVVPRDLWHVAGGPASGERTNLIATRETGKPVCGLYYHVDTVPVAPGWARDPLKLTVEGDDLFGLGAADMKGTIAATLLALRAAKKCGLPLYYDPMLLLCTDEEGGLYPGIRYLAEQGKLKGHILNFNGSAAPRIWAGCFGVFHLQVTIRGHAVHAGEGNRTGAGINAIEGALPLLNALMVLKPDVASRASALAPPPHASGPLRPQLSISAVNGGTAGGQVPAEIKILVSRRYAPEENYEDARAEIERVIRDSVAGTGLKLEIDLVGHLIPTGDPEGPHWPRWQKALSLGFGYKPEDFQKWGAASCSDFGYVQKSGFAQEVLLGGLGRPESCIHSPEEHTTRQDIIALAKSILAYLAADFAADAIPENRA